MGRRARLGIISLILAFFGAACSPASKAKPAPIIIAAASDLIKVSQPLAETFERSTGLQVTFSFGSSGQLEQQIRHGASFDVYAPAARSFCQSIERDGFADGPDKLYAYGRLGVWSKSLPLSSLQDLTSPQVRRIAIANPHYAPYGMAAQQALQAAGLWPKVEAKIVYGETVANALQMAQTGNADVALVAVALTKETGGSLVLVDQSLYNPIEQAAIVLKDSKNKPGARSFRDFLLTPEAQRIFQEYGFGHP